MSKKPILYDIKIATGITIILVVIGHLASRGQVGIDLYVNLKHVIYKFHMPLFLFLSGYIAQYTYKPIESIKDYFSFIKKKFIRLFPAYFIMSFVFFVGKYNLGESTEISEGIFTILFSPADSNSGFLWYLYLLFTFNLCMPIIDYFIKNKFVYFFTISILLSTFVDFPKLFSLNFYFWYLPFYIFGCYCSNNQIKYLHLLKKYGFIVLIIFLSWAFLEFLNIIDVHKNIVSFFAIFGIGYITSIKIVRNVLLEKLGDNSFYIYLFNTIFIGAISLFLINYLGKKTFYNNFYYFAPFFILIGLYFPIWLQKYVISRLPIISKLIR